MYTGDFPEDLSRAMLVGCNVSGEIRLGGYAPQSRVVLPSPKDWTYQTTTTTTAAAAAATTTTNNNNNNNNHHDNNDNNNNNNTHRFMFSFRRHQSCDFREHATSAPAEFGGEIHKFEGNLGCPKEGGLKIRQREGLNMKRIESKQRSNKL